MLTRPQQQTCSFEGVLNCYANYRSGRTLGDPGQVNSIMRRLYLVMGKSEVGNIYRETPTRDNLCYPKASLKLWLTVSNPRSPPL